MGSRAQRHRLRSLASFLHGARHGRLPAVSFIKPDVHSDGHPYNSSLRRFESFASAVCNAVITNRRLFSHTAIFLTFDEAGGYYDSGYVQPIDFFGDGPRVPMQVISPYARAGRVAHTYQDHASVLKFIERNWRLPPLSHHSRDNLPDPRRSKHPYVPANRPAIGDMTRLFDFHHRRRHPPALPTRRRLRRYYRHRG
jgi:phospholipase C